MPGWSARPSASYLHTESHVITLTRGWARVEVDGRAVVLEAPVRVVDQGRWLVPRPSCGRSCRYSRAGRPPRRAPRPGRRPRRARSTSASPSAAPAAEPNRRNRARPPAGRASEAPAESQASADSTRPLPPTPWRDGWTRSRPPQRRHQWGRRQRRRRWTADCALDAPKGAPRRSIMESPIATNPTVTKGVEPGKSGPKTVDPGEVGPIAAVEPRRSPPSGVARDQGRRGRRDAGGCAPRSYPAFTRVVVETSAIGAVQGGSRDAKGTAHPPGLGERDRRAEEVRDGLLESVHVEPAEGDAVVRVTFTGASQEPKTSMLSDPPRLLFDFPRAPEAAARSPLSAPGPLRILVLDAGHGGHDSGATGPGRPHGEGSGARRHPPRGRSWSRRMLGIKVLLTPQGRHLRAPARPHELRQCERADLFVSIHANAHREAAADGVETYFLSSEATDSAARQVAALENSVVQLEKPTGRGAGQRGHREGDPLGPGAVRVPGRVLAPGRDRPRLDDANPEDLEPRREAGRASTSWAARRCRPSSLEIGFVTNPKEERQLKDIGVPRRDRPRHLLRPRRVQAHLGPRARARRARRSREPDSAMARPDGRAPDQLRPVTITRDYLLIRRARCWWSSARRRSSAPPRSRTRCRPS